MTDLSLIKIDGKPLEKLIDVISKAVGTFYKPTAIKREADAEAYKIEVIERAKSKAYAEGKEIEANTIERIEERLLHKAIKNQQNIDNVTMIAASQLSQESNVSDEPVDEDWSTRFFSIVEDVSNEEMQNLWGKILAGEVKQPNSYSLRTLDLVRNLSKGEAETFSRVASYAISNINDNFIFQGVGNMLSEDFNISFTDILLLAEAGLLQSETSIVISYKQTTEDLQFVQIAGNTGMLIDIKAGTPEVVIPVYKFTQAGNELVKLIELNPPFEYLIKYANFLMQRNVVIKHGIFEGIVGTIVTLTDPLNHFPKI
jgi:hypothetical protein